MKQKILRMSLIRGENLVEEVAVEQPSKIQVLNPYRQKRPHPILAKRKLASDQCAKLDALKDCGVGRNLIIVAGGSSANRINYDFDEEKYDVLLVNRPFPKLMHLAKFWCINDGPIVIKYMKETRVFKGEFICSSSAFVPGRECTKVRSLAGLGFSMDLIKGFYLGRSTTLSSLQVAAHCNYDHIYVVGVDMCMGDGLYHDGSTNPRMDSEQRVLQFEREVHAWKHCSHAAPEEFRNKVSFITDLNPYDFIDTYYIRIIDMDSIGWA